MHSSRIAVLEENMENSFDTTIEILAPLIPQFSAREGVRILLILAPFLKGNILMSSINFNFILLTKLVKKSLYSFNFTTLWLFMRHTK